MEGADHLLRLLGSGLYGQWLVLHGHKHHPKLQYGLGGMLSPIVFGAGSLCASLYPELAARARNQFYILDLDVEAAGRLQLDIAGKVNAWDWIPHLGWKSAGRESGLPHSSGFGYRATIPSIAGRIADVVNAQSAFLRWRELVMSIPEVEFLLHSDLEAVIQRLANDHSIEATRDAQGAVWELAKA